jgi:hypothetical protein
MGPAAVRAVEIIGAIGGVALCGRWIYGQVNEKVDVPGRILAAGILLLVIVGVVFVGYEATHQPYVRRLP